MMESLLAPMAFEIKKRAGPGSLPVDGAIISGTEIGLNVSELGQVNVTHVPSGLRVGKPFDGIGVALDFGQRVAGELIQNGCGSKAGPKWTVKNPGEAIENLRIQVERNHGVVRPTVDSTTGS